MHTIPKNTFALWYGEAGQDLHKYNKLAMKYNLATLKAPLNID